MAELFKRLASMALIVGIAGVLLGFVMGLGPLLIIAALLLLTSLWLFSFWALLTHTEWTMLATEELLKLARAGAPSIHPSDSQPPTPPPAGQPPASS